jgi:hypothetical protein
MALQWPFGVTTIIADSAQIDHIFRIPGPLAP